MTQEEFNKYLSDVATRRWMNEISDEKVKTLQIVWEEDIDKIESACLASRLRKRVIMVPQDHIPPVSLKIEWWNINDIELHRVLQSICNDTEFEAFARLLKLIQSGTKIIPPTCYRYFQIVNGEPVRIFNPSISLNDGNHRALLARYMGLKEIPILMVDVLGQYVFDNTLWDIDCNNGFIEFKEKNGSKAYRIFLSNAQGVVNEKSYIFNVLPSE